MNRIPCGGVEMNVVMGCNLACPWCSHYSQFVKGRNEIPLEIVRESIVGYGKRLHPRWFKLLGGEPLLHPNVNEILKITIENFRHTELQFVTNGLLAENMDDEFYHLLKDGNFHFSISRHFVNSFPGYAEKLNKQLDFLNRKGVHYHLDDFSGHSRWRKFYPIRNGKALPADSHFGNAYSMCLQKTHCISIIGRNLYKCPVIGCAVWMVENGFFNKEDWAVLNDVKTVTYESSDSDILRVVSDYPARECTVCHDKYLYFGENE